MRVPLAYLELTRACNERCCYCYNDSGRPLAGELGTDAIGEVVEGFVAQGGQQLMITGGECLLHPGIVDVMERARATPQVRWLAMSTNGLLLDSPRGRAVLELCDEVDISLDGFADIHDPLRGVRSWDKTLAALRLAGASEARLHVNACLTAPLWRDLERYLGLLEEAGVASVKIALIGGVGRQRTPKSLFDGLPARTVIAESLDEVAERWHGRLDVSQSSSRKVSPVTPATDGVVIDPLGRLFPQLGCQGLQWQLGWASPRWELWDESLDRYLDRMRVVERIGSSRVAAGEYVEWWALIRDELESGPEEGVARVD
ncbi:MAG: hypothetical protein CVT62_07620 [Actinobacteria bacterium HGW-Actinobacteria-2]|nr:MAG: hypothetical protein CVT62_07620 [Actinobacteria bacterium HGW-Actinobacteria-2]